MTADDEARVALVRVGELFRAKPDCTLEELRGVENYEQIPESIRETLEGLRPPDVQLLNRIFTTLAENDIYLENGPQDY
jgi:hypothetical protein